MSIVYLSGSIPAAVAKVLAGAKLIALNKSTQDVRPIAVGDCFRRVTAKVACYHLREKISNYLASHQYGVATPSGAELMSHLVQTVLKQNPSWIIIKVDAKNAFNSVHRASFLSEVAKEFPEFNPSVAKCYINPGFLTMRIGSMTKYILSEEGVQQGDPLGPFLFSLALQPILISAAAKHNTVITPNYLDDTMVLEPKEDSIQCYHMVKNQCCKIGLH